MASMVVIKCPETHEEAATGITTDLLHFHKLPDRQSVLRRCPACGKQHRWSKADAYLSIRFGNRPTQPALRSAVRTQAEVGGP
jgi:hypothetical protein